MSKSSGILSKVFTKIGEIVASGIRQEIQELRNMIIAQDKKIDENEKDRIRYEILDFANSCHNGRNHTRDEFEHIISLNDKYKTLLERTKDKNGVFEIEYKYINRLYEQKKEDHTFLAEELKN